MKQHHAGRNEITHCRLRAAFFSSCEIWYDALSLLRAEIIAMRRWLLLEGECGRAVRRPVWR
jgi:hypothetical protein